jgi:hypothetical protein
MKGLLQVCNLVSFRGKLKVISPDFETSTDTFCSVIYKL